MSSTEIALRSSQPVYYHREYKNDIPNVKSEESQDSSLANQCKRVALVALPFISLYKPLSFPLSLAMGGLRTVTCVQQLLESIKRGNSKEIPYAMLQTTIAVISLAGTIFAHPLGMLISTGHDLIIDVVHLMEHLKKGEYQKAMEDCLGIINNALYLALFLHGGLEMGIASLAMQILIGLYHSQSEFRKGHYIEGVGHLLMGMIRGNQLAGQVKILQMKWEFDAFFKKIKTEQLIKKSSGVVTRDDSVRITNSKTLQTNLVNKRLQVGLSNSETPAKGTCNQEIADILIKYKNVHGAAIAGDLHSVIILAGLGGNLEDALSGAIRGRSIEVVKYLVEVKHVSTKTALYESAIIGWWDGFDYFAGKGAEMPNDLFDRVLEYVIYSNYSGPHKDIKDKNGEVSEVEVLNGLISRGIKTQLLTRNENYKEWIERRYRFQDVFTYLFDPQFFNDKKRVEIIHALGDAGFPLDQYFYISERNSGFVSRINNTSGKIKLKNEDWTNSSTKHNRYRGEGSFYRNTTPLQYAIASNNLGLAEAILQSGANPNYVGAPRDYTGGYYGEPFPGHIKDPIQVALLIGNREMIALLIKYSAKFV